MVMEKTNVAGMDAVGEKEPIAEKNLKTNRTTLLSVVLALILNAVVTASLTVLLNSYASAGFHADKSGQLVNADDKPVATAEAGRIIDLKQTATASPELLDHMEVFVAETSNKTEDVHHRIAYTKRVHPQIVVVQTISGDVFAVGPKSYLQIATPTDKNAEDHRRLAAETVQRRLDVCVDMCKELGAYPEKCTCPGYTDTTDKTPGVMTWDELLTYMDDVSSNGHAAIKDWKGMS